MLPGGAWRAMRTPIADRTCWTYSAYPDLFTAAAVARATDFTVLAPDPNMTGIGMGVSLN